MTATQGEGEFRLELQERAQPTQEPQASPGATQAFVTRFEMHTMGGNVVVFDSERQDNTKSHRRVRNECVKYTAPIPERTQRALANYYEREAKRARVANGNESTRRDSQTIIPATDAEPVALSAHPTLRSIESVSWTKEPTAITEPEHWLNRPANLPPKRGRHSDRKEEVMAILLDPEAPNWMRFPEICDDLDAHTESKKEALRNTVRRLVADGRAEISYGREGRSRVMLVRAKPEIREPNRLG